MDAVAASGAGRDALLTRIAEIDERVSQIDQRRRAIERDLASAHGGEVDVEALASALSEFDSIWNELFVSEKAKVLSALIERVTYVSTTGVLRITFKEKVTWRA